MKFLTKKITKIGKIISCTKTQYITLAKNHFHSIAKFHSSKFEPNDIEKFIIKEIDKNIDRSKIICRNLAELYTNITGKVNNKSQVIYYEE